MARGTAVLRLLGWGVAVVVVGFRALVAQDELELAWLRTFDGIAEETDSFVSLVTDADDSVTITGSSNTGRQVPGGPERDIVTLRYDAAGRLVWVARFDGDAPTSRDHRSAGIVCDSKGGVIVVAARGSGPSTDSIALKYDTAGSLERTVRLSPDAAAFDTPTAMARTAGGLYVAGTSDHALADAMFLAALDAGGGVDWVKEVFPQEGQRLIVSSIAASDLGGICCAGRVCRDRDCSFATVRLSGLGDPLWARTESVDGEVTSGATATALDRNGFAYVAGTVFRDIDQQGDSAIKVQCFHPSGETAWEALFSNDSVVAQELPVSLELDEERGLLFLASQTCLGPASCFVTILAYDLDGNEVWAQWYDDPASSTDVVRAMRLDNEFLYLVGWSGTAIGGLEGLILKYDALAGAEVEAIRVGDPNSLTKLHALTFDRSGALLVGGEARVGGSLDYWVGKYVYPDAIRFVRGDVSGDGALNISDAVQLLSFLFSGGMRWPAMTVPTSMMTALSVWRM